MSNAREIVLLGPQRLKPIVSGALKRLGITGSIAVVTAGWEEREGEDRELAEHVGVDVRNLSVYQRVEDIFERDQELFGAMRKRHDTMRKIQTYYRMRLAHALESARELLGRTDADKELLESARDGAIAVVRQLDAEHLDRVDEVHAEFNQVWRPEERELVAHHRQAIASEMGECQALCIAGGHVAILLNRMRLLDVIGLVPNIPILAWAAGAMVLGERVILFHDSPPQGPGDAEVLERGFGLCKDFVALPHASRRLRLEDKARVGLFAKRFGPANCVALDELCEVSYTDGVLRPETATMVLSPDGLLKGLEAA